MSSNIRHNHFYRDEQRKSPLFSGNGFHNHFSVIATVISLGVYSQKYCVCGFSLKRLKKIKRRLKLSPYVKKTRVGLTNPVCDTDLNISFLLAVSNLQCHGQHLLTHWEVQWLQHDFRFLTWSRWDFGNVLHFCNAYVLVYRVLGNPFSCGFLLNTNYYFSENRGRVGRLHGLLVQGWNKYIYTHLKSLHTP